MAPKQYLASFAAVALVACGGSPLGAGDPNRSRAAVILSTVLAYEATLPRERSPTCVAARTRGVAFDDKRQQLVMLRTERPPNPKDATLFRKMAVAAEQPSWEWRRPVDQKSGASDKLLAVDPATAARLDSAAARIVNGAPSRAEPVALSPSMIPAPFWSALPLLHCSRLSLTAPALTDGLAFVETGYTCGGLCGNGWLYALEPRHGRWRIVGIAFTWIS
jgi:hypothetical protein